MRGRDMTRHVAAALAYAGLTWVMVAHGGSLTQDLYGTGSDPTLYIWFLAWWPYALSHHLYPLATTLVWWPDGLNLGWTTSIPLLALLSAPVTLAAGPVVTYNLLMLLAPFAAALAAYALCWRLTRQWPAALAGGYLFGFSSFEITHSAQHLNLATSACLPLLLLVVVERVRGTLGRGAFIAALGILAAAQFLVSTETTATAALIGTLAWALAMVVMPAWREALRRLLSETLAAGALALVLVSPVLYAMFSAPSDIHLPKLWPGFFSTDLLNFVVPTMSTAVGGSLLRGVSTRFPGLLCEQAGYFGLPLLLVLRQALRGETGGRGWFLGLLLGGIVVLSLGPALWVGGGWTGWPLPWALFMHLPLLNEVLPARLMVYAALLSAVITALYLARGGSRGLVLLACIALAPLPHPVMPVPHAAFFAPGEVPRVLGPNPRLLILPFSIQGPSSYWQSESDFAFTQVGGYLGFPPKPAQAYPAVMQMFGNYMKPDFAAAFAAYATRNGAQYVVLGPGMNAAMAKAILGQGWPARAVDDVTILTVPGAAP